MSVHKKLMEARIRLQQAPLKKTGENKFAGYKYFELGDFLPTGQQIFNDLGLCGIVSFTADIASLTITDIESGGEVVITSPMGSAALKGCHEVQNVGAVETYQRRYLWVAAFEIVEHDALDATTGKAAPAQKVKPTDGAWEAMSDESKEFLEGVANEVRDRMTDPMDAADYLNSQQLDSDEKIALWTRLDSKVRTPLTKALNELKKTKE